MKIAVIGPGAMGCLFAARLARAGFDVVLVDKDRERAKRIDARGITLVEGENTQAVEVKSLCFDELSFKLDLVLVFVKAFDTASAALSLNGKVTPQTMVVTLQNGVGSARILREILTKSLVVQGVTSEGATLLAEGEVRHGGSGKTLLGMALPHEVDGVVEVLNTAGFDAEWTKEIDHNLYKKLTVNCAINALTALTGIKNGQILGTSYGISLVRDVVFECHNIIKLCGTDLGEPELLCDHVLAVAHKTAQNRSSMGQDADARRKTEIDFINGHIVELAKACKEPAPVNAALLRLVKTLEYGYGK